jgi:FkbM family methyltransferase
MIRIKKIIADETKLDHHLAILISRTSPDYIVEIGCYDGFTLMNLGKYSPYSKLIGFEANPTNFFKLCLGKNIQNMAMSNKVGKINFYEPISDGSHPSRIYKKKGSIFKVCEVDEHIEYEVSCTTLDTFFKSEIEAGKTFVLIVDAEGATKEILEGGKNFLKNTICLKIEVEKEEVFLGQSLENSCLEKLKDKILVGEQVSIDKKVLKQTNYYFVSDIKYASQFIVY